MPRGNETRPVKLVLATPEDAGPLTVIQGRAFHDDFRFVDPEIYERLPEIPDPAQGPPGVTDIEWTRNMILSPESIYHKILLGDRLVGGVILAADAEKYPEENFWRIFVEPVYHSRGIGQEAFRHVFRLHPDVKRWRLGTPAYATRNRHFYERMGFRLLEIRYVEEAGFRGCEYENALSQEERLKL
jgi:GNAT superfamily N-acetyltransferase